MNESEHKDTQDSKTMENGELKEWLRNQIAEESGIPAQQISFDDDIAKFRLDSLSLVSVSFELESLTKVPVSPAVFSEFNTINKLTGWIISQK